MHNSPTVLALHALHSPSFRFFSRKKGKGRSIRAGRSLESRNNVRSSEILRKFLVERLFQGEKSPSHQSFLVEKRTVKFAMNFN